MSHFMLDKKFFFYSGTRNFLNFWNVADCGHVFVCLNSMDDVISYSTTLVASCRFLVGPELYFWINGLFH